MSYPFANQHPRRLWFYWKTYRPHGPKLNFMYCVAFWALEIIVFTPQNKWVNPTNIAMYDIQQELHSPSINDNIVEIMLKDQFRLPRHDLDQGKSGKRVGADCSGSLLYLNALSLSHTEGSYSWVRGG